jgi:hypothetical protein
MQGQIPNVPRDQGPKPSGHRGKGTSFGNAEKVRVGVGERLAKLGREEHAMRLGDLLEVVAHVEDYRLAPALILLRSHLAATPPAG